MKRNDSADTTRSAKSDKSEENASISSETGAPFLTKPDADPNPVDDSELGIKAKPPVNYIKWTKGHYKARQREIPKDVRPLHLALLTGSYGTIQALLAKGADPDEQDDMGKAPLHIASKSLDVRIMKLLIDFKADVNKLDMLRMNPLHYVLLSGKRNRSNAVVQCMELLISNRVDINAVEITGQSALHFAAIRSEEGWVNVLIRNGAYFCGTNTDDSSSLYIVIKNCPNSLLTCLDTCIIGPDGKMNEDKLSMKQTSTAKGSSEIMLNYVHLQGSREDSRIIKKDPTVFFMNILDLKKHNDDPMFHDAVKNIFMHASTQAYVCFKWSQAKWLYYTLVLFSHLVYSVLYTTYAVIIYKNICKPEAQQTKPEFNVIWSALSTETSCRFVHEHENETSGDHSFEGVIAIICWMMLLPFTCVFVVSELTKVGQHLSNLKKYTARNFLKTLLNYFLDIESMLGWLLIYSFCIISFHESPFDILKNNKEFKVARYQYHACAYGVFITWCLLMLMIGRATELGLYVGMLKTITKTFTKFLSAYICLILAFVLSFFILLNEQHTFADSFPTMIIKVLAMLVGELEYEDILERKELKHFKGSITMQSDMNNGKLSGDLEEVYEQTYFPFTTHIMLTAFMFFMAIIVMNLLFGLAVTDVQKLQKETELRQLMQQLVMVNHMENTVQSMPSFIRTTIQWIVKWLNNRFDAEPANTRRMSSKQHNRKRNNVQITGAMATPTSRPGDRKTLAEDDLFTHARLPDPLIRKISDRYHDLEMSKEKSEKETEEQKLDKLSRQVEEIRLQFHQLIKTLKGNGVNIQADSLASLNSEKDSRSNTLTKSKRDAFKHTYENFGQNNSKKGKKQGHGGHFDSLQDALMNPTALKKKIGLQKDKLERSSTLDDE